MGEQITSAASQADIGGQVVSAFSIASKTDPLILVILLNGLLELGVLWLAVTLIQYLIKKKKD